MQEAEDALDRAVAEHVVRTDSFTHNARLRLSVGSRTRVSTWGGGGGGIGHWEYGEKKH